MAAAQITGEVAAMITTADAPTAASDTGSDP
jgi:hypothetical protein